MGQEGRCEKGTEWGAAGKSCPAPIGVLPQGAQPCPAPHGCAQPLPWHCWFPQCVYLLHITLSDGPAGSQDLSHLGHDRVVVHAGHSHHLIAPRAGQSRVVRAALGGHGSITQKATCWREAGSKEKHPLQGQGLSRGVSTTGTVLVVWDKGQGEGSELALQPGTTVVSPMFTCWHGERH